MKINKDTTLAELLPQGYAPEYVSLKIYVQDYPSSRYNQFPSVHIHTTLSHWIDKSEKPVLFESMEVDYDNIKHKLTGFIMEVQVPLKKVLPVFDRPLSRFTGHLAPSVSVRLDCPHPQEGFSDNIRIVINTCTVGQTLQWALTISNIDEEQLEIDKNSISVTKHQDGNLYIYCAVKYKVLEKGPEMELPKVQGPGNPTAMSGSARFETDTADEQIYRIEMETADRIRKEFREFDNKIDPVIINDRMQAIIAEQKRRIDRVIKENAAHEGIPIMSGGKLVPADSTMPAGIVDKPMITEITSKESESIPQRLDNICRKINEIIQYLNA